MTAEMTAEMATVADIRNAINNFVLDFSMTLQNNSNMDDIIMI